MKYTGAKAESHYDNSHVYCMDCMDALRQTPDMYFDLAVVDPPYGIGFEDGGQYFKRKNKLKGKKWDSGTPQDEYFIELFRASKNQVIWGGNYFDLPATRGFLIWYKTDEIKDRTFSECEYAWTSYNRPARHLELKPFQRNGSRIHPTQKPVTLYDWIYSPIHNYLPQGGKVIDTHLGSGSNRIAADKAGNIEFYGFEIDSEYYEAQEKRYKIFKMQKTLF